MSVYTEPSIQEMELLRLLTPGVSDRELIRRDVRAHIADQQLLARAQSGDKAAIAQIRADQRELAVILARAQAEVDGKLEWLESQQAENEEEHGGN